MASESPEKKIYKAQCHCGQVKFTVALPPLETGATKVNRCNCSICTKKGYLLVYPLRTDVVWTQGEEKLSEYVFGNKNKPHRFCPECGTSILIDFGNTEGKGKEFLAVSARTFDGIEELLDTTIQYTTFDGKNKLGPAYSTES